MQRYGIVLCLFLFLTTLFGKNLKIVQLIEPYNLEQIDVEIDGDRMIIPAGLGGAEIYDISLPSTPVSIGNIELTQCAWGRTYNWDVFGSFAIGTARDCGFGLYDISNTSRPKLLVHRNANDDFDPTPGRQGGASLEDVEVWGDIAIFAAHGAGLVFYDITLKSHPRYIRHFKTENAWSLTLDRAQNMAYVADGDAGIKMINIHDPLKPAIVGMAETSGTARDVRLLDNWLFVAVGTAGVDVFDVSNPAAPIHVDNFRTSGFTSRVAVHGDLVSLSSWDFLYVLRFKNSTFELVAYKNTGGRVMAVGAVNNIIYSAEWDNLMVYEFTDIAGPDIDFPSRLLDFGQVDFGASKTLPLEIRNTGRSALEVSGIAFAYDDYSTPETAFTIEPHSIRTLDITYSPTRTFAGGKVLFFTNDPDEAETFIEVRGNNTREVQEGDVAPHFSLPIIANGSGILSLEELRGRIVVLALFASW